MPRVDMSLEALKNYRGTNPKPLDFDMFWDKQVERANAHPLEYTIEESEIKGFSTITCYDMWFTGIDKAKIYAKYIKPNTNQKVPLILQYHGYPGASRPWFEQIDFAGMGYALLIMDCPGQGGRSEARKTRMLGPTASNHFIMGIDGEIEDLYYVNTFLDGYLLSRIGESLEGIDKSRIYCNGASQGAAFALVCTALNHKIKKCAALYPYLCDYKRVWELDLDHVVYEGLRYYSKWFDQEHSNDEMFLKLGYIDVANFASRIQAEILFGIGLCDVFCPPSTQFAVYNQISSKKELYIYPDYGHEEIPEFDDLLLDYFVEE